MTVSIAAIAGVQVCHAVSRVKKLRFIERHIALAVGIASVVLPIVAIVTLACTTMLQRIPAKKRATKS